ncbi:hypothetical protein ACC758_38830, partial [Rhizobium ruizarguesonis]
MITLLESASKPLPSGRYFLVSTMQDLPSDGADLDEFGQAYAITASSNQSYRRAYVPVPTGVERREPAA